MMQNSEIEALTLELLKVRVEQIADTASDLALLGQKGEYLDPIRQRLHRQMNELKSFMDKNLPN